MEATLQARIEELERELRRATEEAARERQLRRGALDAAPLPIVVADLEGRVLDLNRAACLAFRTDGRVEATGRLAAELLSEEEVAAARKAARQVLDGGQGSTFELNLRDPAGAARRARASLALLRDEAGEAAGLVGTTIDPEYCCAVAAAEARRSESLEAINRLALELATAPADDGIHELIASRLLETTGATGVAVSRYEPVDAQLQVRGLSIRADPGSRADSLAHQLFDGLHLPMREEVLEKLLREGVHAPASLSESTFGLLPAGRCAELAELLGVGDLCTYALRHGGELLGTVVLMMPREGRTLPRELLQVVANLAAVTLQRVDAEEALRESNERFAMFMEHFPSHAVIKDSQGRIIFANRRYADHAGQPLDQLLGRTAAEIFGGDDVARLERDDLDVLSGHEILGRELEHHGRALSTFKFRIPRAGKPPFIGGFTIDVTERVRAEQERARLEARIRQTQKVEGLAVLAGGLAHEFNNLLTGILGHTSLAMADLDPGAPAREALQLVVTSARAAAALTRQLVAYSGQGAVKIRPLDLSGLVDEAGPLLELTISKKSVIKYELARALPAVDADATQVRQLLVNLLVNASEAIGEHGGLITVTTALVHCSRGFLEQAQHDGELAEGDYVSVTVGDDGCGMEPELLARAFDPFFTTKSTGHGLGLAEVVGIVRAHRGAVHVQSEPGSGTRVQVLLPPSRATIEKVAARQRRDAPVTQWRTTGTVLVADDEDFVRLSAVRILSRAGFQVVTASNGQEAVDWVRELKGQLRMVLLDVTMPKLSGPEALREIRALYPNLRVVLSSGHPEERATAAIPADQHSGFAQKPYDVEDLLTVVREALGE